MRVLGIDEVGRGCWAGPLVVVGVILDDEIEGLRDSKKLSEMKRRGFEVEIRKRAVDIAIAWVNPKFIDTYGLGVGMKSAVVQIYEELKENEIDEVIIDGNIDYLKLNNSKAVVGADDRVNAVCAASIVAKQARDRFMKLAHRKYPNYAFDRNVGYGTGLHKAGLEQFGVSDVHRMSFKPVAKLL